MMKVSSESLSRPVWSGGRLHEHGFPSHRVGRLQDARTQDFAENSAAPCLNATTSADGTEWKREERTNCPPQTSDDFCH